MSKENLSGEVSVSLNSIPDSLFGIDVRQKDARVMRGIIEKTSREPQTTWDDVLQIEGASKVPVVFLRYAYTTALKSRESSKE